MYIVSSQAQFAVYFIQANSYENTSASHCLPCVTGTHRLPINFFKKQAVHNAVSVSMLRRQHVDGRFVTVYSCATNFYMVFTLLVGDLRRTDAHVTLLYICIYNVYIHNNPLYIYWSTWMKKYVN